PSSRRSAWGTSLQYGCRWEKRLAELLIPAPIKHERIFADSCADRSSKADRNHHSKSQSDRTDEDFEHGSDSYRGPGGMSKGRVNCVLGPGHAPYQHQSGDKQHDEDSNEGDDRK